MDYLDVLKELETSGPNVTVVPHYRLAETLLSTIASKVSDVFVVMPTHRRAALMCANLFSAMNKLGLPADLISNQTRVILKRTDGNTRVTFCGYESALSRSSGRLGTIIAVKS